MVSSPKGKGEALRREEGDAGGTKEEKAAAIPCSICLEVVVGPVVPRSQQPSVQQQPRRHLGSRSDPRPASAGLRFGGIRPRNLMVGEERGGDVCPGGPRGSGGHRCNGGG
jgi:hypothetical protein